MDEPVFDAMLKTALEEAAMEDLPEQAPSFRTSLRHRRRMRKMLADPVGYYRRATESEMPLNVRRAGSHVTRWVAVAVLAALLTGTAMGYAMGGGEFFRRMMDGGPWAAVYAGASDTERLPEMAGGNVGTVVEDENFRFELLDAVSEGQNAMAAVRITVLNTDCLEQAFGEVMVPPGTFLDRGGSLLATGSYGIQFIYADMDETLDDNQFCMIFRSSQNKAAEGRTYTITFRDFGYYRDGAEGEQKEIVLIPGVWTLEVELDFDGGETIELNETIQMEDCAFTVDTVTLSAMSIGVVLHCPWEEADALGAAVDGVVLVMQDGQEVPCTGYSLGGGGEDEEGFFWELMLEFPMPLERENFKGLRFGDQELLF